MNITKLESFNSEYHLPGYKFCGPGTKIYTRLLRGDKGINKLDDACKCHDIEYMMYAGMDDKLQMSDEKLRQAAKKFGGIASSLIDKIFLMKKILENLRLISPSKFALGLANNLTIQQQRQLGKLLYKKYILKYPNIDLSDYY